MIPILLASFLGGILYRYGQAYISLKGMAISSAKLDFRTKLYKLVSTYLLIQIGLNGGAEIAGYSVVKIAASSAMAIGVSILISLLALVILKYTAPFKHETRVSLAVHYGSVSIGTFAAALAFLDGIRIPYSPMVTSWVALMELPAVFVGVLLLGQGIRTFKRLLAENGALLFLPGTFMLGLILGPEFLKIKLMGFLFHTLFEPVLAYFLFEMGRQAGDNLRQLVENRRILILFGIGMPILGGTLGIAIARWIGLELGDSMILGTLAASASYVAAPTAMRTALSKHDKVNAAISTSLTASLGITLPFNVLFGLRIYLSEAEVVRTSDVALKIILFIFLGIGLFVFWRARQSIERGENLLARNVNPVSMQPSRLLDKKVDQYRNWKLHPTFLCSKISCLFFWDKGGAFKPCIPFVDRSPPYHAGRRGGLDSSLVPL